MQGLLSSSLASLLFGPFQDSLTVMQESCDLEREYVVQFSTKGWFGRKKGKKSQRTKTERVIVKRGGGYLSGGSCSS